MSSLFVIREISTGAFCTSQRFGTFSNDLQDAVTFVSFKNAEKAIRGMTPKEERKTFVAEDYDMEVVEVKLVLV